MRILNKPLLGLIGLFAMSTLMGSAVIKFPKDAFEAVDTAKAHEAAIKAKKPLAFILTKKDTDCPSSAGITEDFLKVLGKKCVIVYLPVGARKSYSALLDKKVSEELLKGRVYPNLVIVEPEGWKILYSTHCREYKKDPRGSIRDIRKVLLPAR